MRDPIIHVAEMTKELTDRIAAGNVADADIPNIAQEIIRRKRVQLNPAIAGHPKEGQLMIDATGNKAMVFPDGEIKEIA